MKNFLEQFNGVVKHYLYPYKTNGKNSELKKICFKYNKIPMKSVFQRNNYLNYVVPHKAEDIHKKQLNILMHFRITA